MFNSQVWIKFSIQSALQGKCNQLHTTYETLSWDDKPVYLEKHLGFALGWTHPVFVSASEAVLLVIAGFSFVGRALRCKLRVAFCRIVLKFLFLFRGFYLRKFVQSWKEMLFHVSVWFYFRIILSISRHMDVFNGSLILFHVMFYSGLSWISEKTARTLLSIICTFRARRFSLHAQTSSFMRFSLCDDFH